jgi:hypothetical protein
MSLPMTTFGGDGQASIPVSEKPKMFDNSNIEDVEQSETDEADFDKAVEEFSQWLNEQIEDLPDLPTADEAQLGELCKTPTTQFDQCKLVDEGTGDLIEALEEGGR